MLTVLSIYTTPHPLLFGEGNLSRIELSIYADSDQIFTRCDSCIAHVYLLFVHGDCLFHHHSAEYVRD